MPRAPKVTRSADSTAHLGFEAKLWLAVDKLRNNMDAAEYRRKQTLFIDARKMGTLIDRVHRELTDTDIARIVDTYHAWLGLPSPAGRRDGDEGDPTALQKYEDVPGFCKSATTAEIAGHSWVLTPGRYVGAEEVEDDGDPFEEKMPRLVTELHAQFAESAKLEARIKRNLEGLGYAL